MPEDTQESRRETVAAAVSKSEKRYLKLVAQEEGTDVSTLIRDRIADLIERGRRLESSAPARVA